MFIIKGLDGSDFQHLYELSDHELSKRGAVRIKVNEYPSYPDRITLRDIPLGENAILLNHLYLNSHSPYRGSHAIFIWEGKIQPAVLKNTLPEVMQTRLISLRAFDINDMLVVATISSGYEIETSIQNMFKQPQIEFILAHNAKQGCFSCRITRCE
ncbi:DUF1203 domain-containing protein [Rouxiella sp. WC2420]|uniref:DUF1203 domain-containing protein n=1 Tax=Rouxiella sp. WC2420 TaxID=3234145 RepID=A0AB39VWI7_9GAMM